MSVTLSQGASPLGIRGTKGKLFPQFTHCQALALWYSVREITFQDDQPVGSYHTFHFYQHSLKMVKGNIFLSASIIGK